MKYDSTMIDARKKAFLEALALHGNKTEAAKLSGVPKSTAYSWREDDPEFDKAWGEAVDEAADNLELHAHTRARDAEKPSDVLTIVLLKSLRPEKYRENYSFSGDLNVTGGLTLSAAIDEQITKAADELGEAKRRLEAERQLPVGSDDITGEPV